MVVFRVSRRMVWFKVVGRMAGVVMHGNVTGAWSMGVRKGVYECAVAVWCRDRGVGCVGAVQSCEMFRVRVSGYSIGDKASQCRTSHGTSSRVRTATVTQHI